MALSVWPLTLPQTFQVEGFHTSAPKNRVRSSVDGAVAKMRRKNSNVKKDFGGTMKFTDAQRDIFWNFYTETLKSGVLSFTFPNPPYGSSTIVVQFKEEPDETAEWPLWRVTIELEELP